MPGKGSGFERDLVICPRPSTGPLHGTIERSSAGSSASAGDATSPGVEPEWVKYAKTGPSTSTKKPLTRRALKEVAEHQVPHFVFDFDARGNRIPAFDAACFYCYSGTSIYYCTYRFGFGDAQGACRRPFCGNCAPAALLPPLCLRCFEKPDPEGLLIPHATSPLDAVAASQTPGSAVSLGPIDQCDNCHTRRPADTDVFHILCQHCTRSVCTACYLVCKSCHLDICRACTGTGGWGPFCLKCGEKWKSQETLRTFEGSSFPNLPDDAQAGCLPGASASNDVWLPHRLVRQDRMQVQTLLYALLFPPPKLLLPAHPPNP